VVAGAANDPPQITSIPRGSVRLGSPYFYAIVASDPNGDPLTYQLTDPPAGMAVDAGGFITWTPTAAQFGPNPVTVRVEDGRGGVANQGFTVNVVSNAINQPPEITSGPQFAATLDKLYAYDATATIEKAAGNVARPARDVEKLLWHGFRRGKPVDQVVFPEPMQAAGHDIVHQVVAARDARKHRVDQPLALAGLDRLEAETRLAFLRVVVIHAGSLACFSRCRYGLATAVNG
jgi:hypothetical protein